MKKMILAIALMSALAACNTVEGIGEDISEGARAVDRAF
ncbi:MAG: entericidin EcnAB [Rhodobacteraceae bacterium]|nr:entericidin EcnAB [Paracoccaceae bacterium]